LTPAGVAELAQVFDLRQFGTGQVTNLLSWEVLYICLSGANRGKFAAMNFESLEPTAGRRDAQI
jgi:hypothetical protein